MAHTLSSALDDMTLNAVTASTRAPQQSVPQAPLSSRRACFIWDVENCQFPKYKSVTDIVKHIRHKFLERYGAAEARFCAVFDASKEHKDISDNMHHAGVSVVHANSTSKNAADFQMISEITAWGRVLAPNDVMVCISGDVNFADVLRTLRYSHKLYITIIHPSQTKQQFLSLADEHFSWEEELAAVPVVEVFKNRGNTALNAIVVVDNLDRSMDRSVLLHKVKEEISNAGGRVLEMDFLAGKAELGFPNTEGARRAKFRLNGKQIGSRKLRCTFHPKSDLYAEDLRTGGLEIGDADEPATTARGYNRIQPPAQSVPGNIDSATFRMPIRPPVRQPPPVRVLLPTPHSAPNLRSSVPVANPFQSFDRLSGGPVRQPAPRSFVSIGNSMASVSYQAPRFPVEDYFPNDASWPADEVNPSRDGLSPSQFLNNGESPPQASSGSSSSTFFKRNAAKNKAPDMPVSDKEKTPSFMQQYMRAHGPKGDAKARAALRAAGLDSSPERSHKLPDPIQPQRVFGRMSAGVPLIGEGNNRPSSSSPGKNQGTDVKPSWVPVVAADSGETVDIYIQNLDNNVDRDKLWAELNDVLEERVSIEKMELHEEEFGTAFAHVIVQQRHIEELMRIDRMPFYNRILTVSLDDPNLPLSSTIKHSVVQVFQRAKKDALPYYELMRLFYRDYGQDLELRTIRKMKDLVKEVEENGKSVVVLFPDWERKIRAEGAAAILPWGYCVKHCGGDVDLDKLLPKKPYRPLTLYKESLGRLGERVVAILEKHKGALPLNSFTLCYEEFYPRLVENQEEGAYLEHLLLSIPRVEIRQNRNEPRMLMLVDRPCNTGGDTSATENLEARGLLEMLIQRDRASVRLADFGEVYHRFLGIDGDLRHFDPTRMLRLVQSVSDDFEVIGVGVEQLVTLTHAAQLRRFAAELVEIRRALGATVTVDDIAHHYTAVLNRDFKPTSFGVAFAKDLFPDPFRKDETPPSSDKTVSAKKQAKPAAVTEMEIANKENVSVPSAALSALEREVIEMLSESASFKLELLRFPSTYQNRFKKPLVLRNYGWAKMVDLVEGMPDTLEIVLDHNTRHIQLKLEKRLEYLRQFLTSLCCDHGGKASMTLDQLKSKFKKRAKRMLCFEDYDCESYEELFFLMDDIVKMSTNDLIHLGIPDELPVHDYPDARPVHQCFMMTVVPVAAGDEGAPRQPVGAPWMLEPRVEHPENMANYSNEWQQDIFEDNNNVLAEQKPEQPSVASPAKSAVFGRLAMNFG